MRVLRVVGVTDARYAVITKSAWWRRWFFDEIKETYHILQMTGLYHSGNDAYRDSTGTFLKESDPRVQAIYAFQKSGNDKPKYKWAVGAMLVLLMLACSSEEEPVPVSGDGSANILALVQGDWSLAHISITTIDHYKEPDLDWCPTMRTTGMSDIEYPRYLYTFMDTRYVKSGQCPHSPAYYWVFSIKKDDIGWYLWTTEGERINVLEGRSSLDTELMVLLPRSNREVRIYYRKNTG